MPLERARCWSSLFMSCEKPGKCACWNHSRKKVWNDSSVGKWTPATLKSCLQGSASAGRHMSIGMPAPSIRGKPSTWPSTAFGACVAGSRAFSNRERWCMSWPKGCSGSLQAFAGRSFAAESRWGSWNVLGACEAFGTCDIWSKALNCISAVRFFSRAAYFLFSSALISSRAVAVSIGNVPKNAALAACNSLFPVGKKASQQGLGVRA
mmetsp:Transcript_24085/g.67023  ORF Transcript_24085/g.67023 Transcript_24085/m.67023 type:complete len:208 (-) Transcript_24085:52-675(-)